MPPLLRQHAQLEKKLVLLGQPRKIEIWGEDHWEAHRETLISNSLDPETIPEDVEAVPL